MSQLSESGHAQNKDMKGKWYESGFSTPTIPTQRESLHDSNTTTTTTASRHHFSVPLSTASYLSFYRYKENAGSCSECISVLWKQNQSISDNYILKNYASLVAQSIKNLPAGQETRVRSLGQEDPLEKEMATYSSILAWKIPWTEEPGRHSPWGCKESETTEQLHFHFHFGLEVL